MDSDIDTAIAEFKKRGGEIKQLPDQVDPKTGPNKNKTKFHFGEWGQFTPQSGQLRASYASNGKNLTTKELLLRGFQRRAAIKRHNMHGKIAHEKRQQRLATISRY